MLDHNEIWQTSLVNTTVPMAKGLKYFPWIFNKVNFSHEFQSLDFDSLNRYIMLIMCTKKIPCQPYIVYVIYRFIHIDQALSQTLLVKAICKISFIFLYIVSIVDYEIIGCFLFKVWSCYNFQYFIMFILSFKKILIK